MPGSPFDFDDFKTRTCLIKQYSECLVTGFEEGKRGEIGPNPTPGSPFDFGACQTTRTCLVNGTWSWANITCHGK